jgi:hypothetical protein
MSTLDSRGHEVVDPRPFEPVVPIRRQPSIADMVRAERFRKSGYEIAPHRPAATIYS